MQSAAPPAPPPREDSHRFAWLARILGRLMGAYVRLVARTARIGGSPIGQEQVIFAIWHEANLAASVAAFRLRKPGRAIAFSTRGFRGIVMNAMLGSLGSGSVTLPEEGAAGRAEAAAMTRTLARIGQSGWSLLVSCDGPLGPPRIAKPGVLIVARESGLPVQPWALSIRPALRMTRRWDRQLLPLPFCRLTVHEGTQLRVAERERVKPLLATLQSEMDRVAQRADREMA